MPKNVLLIINGKIHPPLMGRFWLRNILVSIQGFDFTCVNSMEYLPELDLSRFDSMVLYFHHKKISEVALDAFDVFVSRGGGVLGIHSVTASFKNSDKFTDILGGKFTGHGPVGFFSVIPVEAKSEIFRDIPEFRVKDELYLHSLKPDIETQFNTIYDGEHVPVIWTRTYGKGRVCFSCPGHRATSLRVPEYQLILTRALAWVSNCKLPDA